MVEFYKAGECGPVFAVTPDGEVWQYLGGTDRWRFVPSMSRADMFPDFPGDFGAGPGNTPATPEEAAELMVRIRARDTHSAVDPWYARQPAMSSEQLGL
jgi:hypothetical protein